MTLPLSLVRDLRCRHCSRFVSCGPVHVVPDGGILCGRCRMLAKPKFRNIAYEALATGFFFPCCYWTKHCPAKLRWNECIDHERDCNYQSGCSLFWSHPGVLCSSDRKLPENDVIVLEHATEEMLEELKCVACESYLSCDPVHIGSDGKNICHRCVTSNGVPQGCIRNFSYERLASAIIFPCIYRFRGCTIRLRYGREMWKHEAECSYGQVFKKNISKQLSKNGKERGVIQTHSGHIYGTITPNSALFGPPKPNEVEGSEVRQELVHVVKMKHGSDDGVPSPKAPSPTHKITPPIPDYSRSQSFDSQSLESLDTPSGSSSTKSTNDNLQEMSGSYFVMNNAYGNGHGNGSSYDHSRASSYDHSRNSSVYNSGSFQGNIPRPSLQVHQQNHHQQQHQHKTSSSRPPTREDDYRTPRDSKASSDFHLMVNGYHNGDLDQTYGSQQIQHPISQHPQVPPPLPTSPPPQLPQGFYQDNLYRYNQPPRPSSYLDKAPYFNDLGHFPPIYFDQNYAPNINYSNSFNYGQNENYHPNVAKRSESLRVGNKDLIEELKARNKKKQEESKTHPISEDNPYVHCDNLQDIVQLHDEVFVD